MKRAIHVRSSGQRVSLSLSLMERLIERFLTRFFTRGLCDVLSDSARQTWPRKVRLKPLLARLSGPEEPDERPVRTVDLEECSIKSFYHHSKTDMQTTSVSSEINH